MHVDDKKDDRNNFVNVDGVKAEDDEEDGDGGGGGGGVGSHGVSRFLCGRCCGASSPATLLTLLTRAAVQAGGGGVCG